MLLLVEVRDSSPTLRNTGSSLQPSSGIGGWVGEHLSPALAATRQMGNSSSMLKISLLVHTHLLQQGHFGNLKFLSKGIIASDSIICLHSVYIKYIYVYMYIRTSTHTHKYAQLFEKLIH